MKTTLSAIVLLFISLNCFSQDDNQKLPPFEMLPQKAGEMKEIYYLPYETIYQIYDIKGVQLKDSIAEFIDMTMLNKGVYFISYDGKKIKYEKKTDPPKSLTPAKECN